VILRFKNKTKVASIANLGLGGMYVECVSADVSQGDSIVFNMPIVTDGIIHDIQAQGKIVWLNSASNGKQAKGFGLAFESLSRHEMRIIEQFVRLTGRKLRKGLLATLFTYFRIFFQISETYFRRV